MLHFRLELAPEFMGSFSIKKVAPAILGETASYTNLEIGDGIEAMLAYDQMVSLPNTSGEKASLIRAMLEYCRQDTMLMVQLHQCLNKKLARNHRQSIEKTP